MVIFRKIDDESLFTCAQAVQSPAPGCWPAGSAPLGFSQTPAGKPPAASLPKKSPDQPPPLPQL